MGMTIVATAKPFGYGIIGCGWVASAHAWGVRALEPEQVRLDAVADRDIAVAEHLATRFGGAAYGDYRSLLARDDIDAVSVCVPDFLHEEVTLAATASGKHVLCEKPLATDSAAANRMVESARHHGVSLGIVFNHRYAPDNIRVRSAIRAGALGRLLIGDVIHSSSLTGDPDNSSPWRGRRGLAAGGILSTQAIHFLDLLLWFAGPVASVLARTAQLVRVDQDYEDTAALSLRHVNGVLSTLITTNGSPIADDFTGTRVEIQGTAGYVALEGDRLQRSLTTDERPMPPAPTLPVMPEEASEVVFGAGHLHEVVDFVRAARAGAPAPVPGEDGRHLMEVVEAAYRSAQQGCEAVLGAADGAYADVPYDSLLSGLRR